MMFQTLEATLDPQGKIHFTEDLQLKGVHRVLITVMERVESSRAPWTRQRRQCTGFLAAEPLA